MSMSILMSMSMIINFNNDDDDDDKDDDKDDVKVTEKGEEKEEEEKHDNALQKQQQSFVAWLEEGASVVSIDEVHFSSDDYCTCRQQNADTKHKQDSDTNYCVVYEKVALPAIATILEEFKLRHVKSNQDASQDKQEDEDIRFDEDDTTAATTTTSKEE